MSEEEVVAFLNAEDTRRVFLLRFTDGTELEVTDPRRARGNLALDIARLIWPTFLSIPAVYSPNPSRRLTSGRLIVADVR